MKSSYKILLSTLAVLMVLTTAGFAQNYPSGGYQGGTHGNVNNIKWYGGLNEKWNEPGNWCPAKVPGSTDNVIITSAAPNMPEVKATGMSCKSLTIEPGAEVIIKPGYVLTVNGQEVE